MTFTEHNTSIFSTLVAAGFAVSMLGACDLDLKDIGDETDGMADDGNDDDSGPCVEGETMPAPDGCNTCVCDADGSWACTEIGCVDDGMDSGEECEPGDMMPADDGCNTCTCGDDGIWACTLLGCVDDQQLCEDTGGTWDETSCGHYQCGMPPACAAVIPGCDCGEGSNFVEGSGCIGDDTCGSCEPGDTMPADDGCNTCTCDDSGFWACTEIACPEMPLCMPGDPTDPFNVTAAAIVGDELQVTVAYSGGCAEHIFSTCWSGEWLESDPVQTGITITHDDPGDVCDAFPSENHSFDLLPLQLQYAASYGPTGTITINLDGWGSLDYSF